MSEVNIPLLRKAVEWAEAEAAKPKGMGDWHQGAWQTYHDVEVVQSIFDENDEYVGQAIDVEKASTCGTAYCIAGYVAAMTHPEHYKYSLNGYAWDSEKQDYARDEDGRMLPHASEVARLELGLSDGQADALFAGGNGIERVREVADNIAGERL